MTAIGRLLDDYSRRRRPLRSLGASGQLGYGIPTPAFESGLARAPDMIGYRALLIAGAADPRFIARHEEIFAAVSRVVSDLVSEDAIEDYRLAFRLYGVDGVRAWTEPPSHMPREALVMGECIAPTPDRAEEVIRTTKQYLLHHGYEGRLSTAGNLAFPFTPPEVMIGEAYRFNVFHLMDIDDMARLFPVQVETVA
jgi:hypothetical protein